MSLVFYFFNFFGDTVYMQPRLCYNEQFNHLSIMLLIKYVV